MDATTYDKNWRRNSDARGYYHRDPAYVVGPDGRIIGAEYASMRSALSAASRIPGAVAVRKDS